MGRITDEFGIEESHHPLFWCLYCKEPIYKGQKYVVNEEGNKLHKECDDLISDNADYFGRL